MPPVQDFKSKLLSPQFVFLIGFDHKKFTVPAGFISALSPSLDALMNNGSMKESTDRTVVFENLTSDLFAAVCEYAYTGGYQVPRHSLEDECEVPEEVLKSEGLGIKEEDLQRESKQPIEKSVDFDWGFGSETKKARSKSSAWQDASLGATTMRRLQQSFANLRYDINPPEEPQSRNLMFHARLYAFAEEQLIETLQTRCLGHIHHELQDLEFEGDRCGMGNPAG